ncbi:CPBP family intramembrane glutamic endopeptidase [Natronobiforma cellulositropha]|uniref:CPBP family intramembrane glutamic endopeptidase n=1 Tax=Natronobiforma cellulositropha TaxID=1679076 RepID=UPI0021D57710|nr:CPBP family intramembrane glutamic endopeptidase [Natronobiforma cellulositropha]
MSELTHTGSEGGEPQVGDGFVPAAGTVLSGVAMASMAVPVRRGSTDPLVLAALALAAVSLVVFLARRHGGLGRVYGAPVAVGATLSVLALSGYVLNQGVNAAVGIPLLERSVPLVFVAFLAAGGALAMALADHYSLSTAGVFARSQLTVLLTIVAAFGFLAASVWIVLFALPVVLVYGGFTPLQLVAIEQIGMALGALTVAVAFLQLTERDWSFIDLRVPTLRDLGWTVGGTVAIFGALFAISVLMTTTGVESSSHGVTDRVQESPEIMYVLIPAAILLIGPFEELLYRNVVQKSLYERFSRGGAIVVASVVFAAVHYFAYSVGGAAPGAILASLMVVFGLSLVLGVLYERTDNLVVPALVHGIYDAILFANLYLAYA